MTLSRAGFLTLAPSKSLFKNIYWMKEQTKCHGYLDELAMETSPSSVQFSSVQLLSRVRLFAWIAARQASLSITNSRSSLRFTFIELAVENFISQYLLIQFSSVTQSRLTLCDPMNCSTPVFPVLHQFLECIQTHIHRVSDATQPSHPLSSPSPPAPNPSQHQSLFQW